MEHPDPASKQSAGFGSDWDTLYMKLRKLLLLLCISHWLGFDPSWEWNRCACLVFRGECFPTVHPESIFTVVSLTTRYSKCLMFSVCVIVVELPVNSTNSSPQIPPLLNAALPRQIYAMSLVDHLMICLPPVVTCHVMSCHDTLCYVMLCYVMLCHVMLC